jgi:hypothetical protein
MGIPTWDHFVITYAMPYGQLSWHHCIKKSFFLPGNRTIQHFSTLCLYSLMAGFSYLL